MQRDTDFTIGDVIDSLNISPLRQFSRQNAPQETYSNLRFLKIPHLENHTNLYPGVTCELTERGAHPGELNYVAVSYCWGSFERPGSDANDNSSRPLPTVLVEQQGEAREPRCPAKILIRAIMFAISSNVSLIWIDQECIDQEDETDVRNHLECNHVIFDQAKFKVGLLTFELMNELQLSCLIGIPLAHRTTESYILRDWGVRGILNDIQYLTRLLKAISRDRWFTRTWVFQERHSASIDMCLLLPVSYKVLENFQPSFGIDLVGEDFAVSVGEICSIAAIWRSHLSDPELNRQLQENVAIKEAVHKSLNSLHDTAQLLSGPIFAGASFDTVWDTFPSGTGPSQDISHVYNFSIYRAFLGIESCDNSIVSDRVAILSNLMGFERRFPTTSFRSYSFALVSLIIANGYFPSILVRKNGQDPRDLFARPVSAMYLITHAYNLKGLISGGEKALQPELDNISYALADFFEKDITRYESKDGAIEDAMEALGAELYEDPVEYLSALEMEHIKSVSIVPLSSTIGDLLGGIVAEEHVDNVGLDYSHGETVVRHGIQTKQLKEGDTFIAFDGAYRWRSGYIEEFFD
jgi:Heterokaryon incompatibility protein (HET)